MKINRYASAVENLFLLIEAANPGLDLTPQNVTLGAPTAYDGSATGDDTVITVTAIPDQGFSGQKDVTYNRLTLEEAMEESYRNQYHSGTGFMFSPDATEADIKSAIYISTGWVPDGGLVFTDENGGVVTAPASGGLKMALVNPATDSLLYNTSPEPLGLLLCAANQIHINPKENTINGLDLFTAFGSPTVAGLFVYVNRGIIGGPTGGPQLPSVRITQPFPAGSKVVIVNEGLIVGAAATSYAYGDVRNLAGAIATTSSSNGAAYTGFTVEVQNAIGQVAAPGGNGGVVRINSPELTSAAFPAGLGAGYHRIATSSAPSITSVTNLSYETVREQTPGDLSTPGQGGIWNVTITNPETMQSITGQVTTGDGGQWGHAGTAATVTGFDDLATIAPGWSIIIGAGVTVPAIKDPGGILTWKSGSDSAHFHDQVV